MREIKFRAWNKKEKIMWSWDTINRSKVFALDSKLPYKEDWIAIPNHKDIVLMQYTGLKDKNGKEIYEGDIIHFFHLGTKRIGIIKYADKWASFYIGTKNKYKINIAVTSVHSWYYREEDENTLVEIIGNIWENGDLLNETEYLEKCRK